MIKPTATPEKVQIIFQAICESLGLKGCILIGEMADQRSNIIVTHNIPPNDFNGLALYLYQYSKCRITDEVNGVIRKSDPAEAVTTIKKPPAMH